MSCYQLNSEFFSYEVMSQLISYEDDLFKVFYLYPLVQAECQFSLSTLTMGNIGNLFVTCIRQVTKVSP